MNRPNLRKQQEQFDYLIKMLLIGDSAVGKTNIMFRFCDSTYIQSHMPTVGVDFKMKTIKVDAIQLKLQIWDTAGQEKYLTMTHSIYNGAAAVIVVYSITDRNSFNNVRMWIKQISEHASEQIVVILVGNKCDESENQRKVDKAEGQSLANEFNVPFFETSAKDNLYINELFEEAARQIKDKILPNNGQNNTDSSHKIRLDTNNFTSTPSPMPNTNQFQINTPSQETDQQYVQTAPFSTENPNKSTCQC